MASSVLLPPARRRPHEADDLTGLELHVESLPGAHLAPARPPVLPPPRRAALRVRGGERLRHGSLELHRSPPQALPHRFKRSTPGSASAISAGTSPAP